LEMLPLLLQVVVQRLLNDLERRVVVLEDPEVLSVYVFIGPVAAEGELLGPFHDVLPGLLRGLELAAFLLKAHLAGVRGQNRLQIDVVLLVDGPLVEQFLQHPEHLDLVFDSCADAVDVPRGHDVVQSEQGVVQPRNHVFVVPQDVGFGRAFIRRHLDKF